MLSSIDLNTAVYEPVAFADIKAGDTIAHYVRNNFGDDLIWVGVASRFSSVGNTWYGDGRTYAERTTDPDNEDASVTDGTWGEARSDSREDVTVVIDWHETEENHFIYKVVG